MITFSSDSESSKPKEEFVVVDCQKQEKPKLDSDAMVIDNDSQGSGKESTSVTPKSKGKNKEPTHSVEDTKKQNVKPPPLGQTLH